MLEYSKQSMFRVLADHYPSKTKEKMQNFSKISSLKTLKFTLIWQPFFSLRLYGLVEEQLFRACCVFTQYSGKFWFSYHYAKGCLNVTYTEYNNAITDGLCTS